MQPTTKRRLGICASGLGVVGVVVALAGGPASAHPGPEPPPEVVPAGTCLDYAASHGGGQVWLEVRFDADELYDGSSKGGVTLTWHGDNTFNWHAPMGVDAVFVGAGEQGNLYVYAPDAAAFEHVYDDVLTAPGPITHISFCYDDSAATTTTTEATTSTTEATTTTTEATTTTQATTTTLPEIAPESGPGDGAVLGVTATAPPTAVGGVQASQALPRTGVERGELLALALALLVGGAALVVLGDGTRVLRVRRR